MGIPPKTAAVYIEMYKAINAGVVAAQEPRSPENSTPTSFEEFVQDVFAAAYHGQGSHRLACEGQVAARMLRQIAER